MTPSGIYLSNAAPISLARVGPNRSHGGNVPGRGPKGDSTAPCELWVRCDSEPAAMHKRVARPFELGQNSLKVRPWERR